MNKFALALLGTTMFAGAANAAVYQTTFENRLGTQTVDTALVAGDGITVIGAIASGTGVLSNSVNFTLADGVSDLTATAVSFDFGPFGLSNFSYTLLDTASTVLFQGAGATLSTLSLTNLSAGEYTLFITGDLTAFGNYDLKIGVTPIPAAAALLIPALAGLGFAARRRA